MKSKILSYNCILELSEAQVEKINDFGENRNFFNKIRANGGMDICKGATDLYFSVENRKDIDKVEKIILEELGE